MAPVEQNPPANTGEVRDTGSSPRLGRPPGGGHSSTRQYSCLEQPTEKPGGLRLTGPDTTEAAWRACTYPKTSSLVERVPCAVTVPPLSLSLSCPTDLGPGPETWHDYQNVKQTWASASDDFSSLVPGMPSRKNQPRETQLRQQDQGQSPAPVGHEQRNTHCFCKPLRVWRCLILQQKLTHTWPFLTKWELFFHNVQVLAVSYLHYIFHKQL